MLPLGLRSRTLLAIIAPASILSRHERRYPMTDRTTARGKPNAGPEFALPDLLRSPREALDIEIKDWLDLSDANQRADLAKAILALANHGGGFLLIGLTEGGDGQFSPSFRRPADLTGLSPDAIQEAVRKYL